MTRRWLVSCGSMAISTTLVAMAWSQTQAPPTLSERFQQLRNGWSADPSTTANAPAAGTAPATTPTERRSMLPKVDPRSLLPDNLFGRSTAPTAAPEPTPAMAPPRKSPPTQAHLKPATAAASQMNSQQLGAGSAPATQPSASTVMLPGLSTSTAKTSPSPSPSPRLAPVTPVPATKPTETASSQVRRSPPHRTPPNFDSEALRNELSGSFPTAESTPAPTTAGSEPTAQDDFAAGLEKEAESLGRGTTSRNNSTATAEPTADSSKPIRLQPGSATPRTAKGGAASDGRYSESKFPSVGGLIGRKIESEPQKLEDESGPAQDSSVIVSDEAVKAFRFDTKPYPTSKPAEPQQSPRESPRYATAPSTNPTPRESFAEPKSSDQIETGLLVTNEAPAISSDIRGPQQITIGREATYEVSLKNTGTSAAQELVATIRIPSWADVVSTTTSHGIVRQGEGSDPSSALQWEIPRLDSNADDLLTLKLIPRASRPLELGVTWTHAPVDARTVVEVQEPKLQMSVSGPDEVLYGKPHVYRLSIANPGTGTAENVRIDLMPPGGGRESVSTHALGNLKPGETKSVEIELTAREAGKLNVQAVASADGGLSSDAVKELFCRKPELEVDWRGPETQYAGTPATYFFRVRNPGTATAEDVIVRVALPTGAEFVSASEGYREDAKAGEVAWRVGSLGPGDDCYMELRCVVHTPGENEVRVAAATQAGDLADNKLATTKVVALADLKLDVSDPAGPVPVGEEALYEIRVTNRGANAAEEVNVVGLFSAGLEPEMVEGSAYTATDGRVSFRTIRKLPAGQNVVLQIRAKASQAGTHVFRAEVLCRDLEIKLAAEETTRFYANQSLNDTKGSSPTMIGSRPAKDSQRY